MDSESTSLSFLLEQGRFTHDPRMRCPFTRGNALLIRRCEWAFEYNIWTFNPQV